MTSLTIEPVHRTVYVYVDGESNYIRTETAFKRRHFEDAILAEAAFVYSAGMEGSYPDPGPVLRHRADIQFFWDTGYGRMLRGRSSVSGLPRRTTLGRFKEMRISHTMRPSTYERTVVPQCLFVSRGSLHNDGKVAVPRKGLSRSRRAWTHCWWRNSWTTLTGTILMRAFCSRATRTSCQQSRSCSCLASQFSCLASDPASAHDHDCCTCLMFSLTSTNTFRLLI